ncbi:MAG: hypothetical protein KBD01_02110 [Acidobacteria bacterium]|nr:hypothetical protein [Acidobacteriota bacterium]
MNATRTATLLFAALAVAATPATAIDRDAYSMQVLVNGRPVSEYPARGTTYVEALRGHEYSVRLTNHTGQRVAIALSVDGLNSIDARSTTPHAASKWVLGPYESITIDGWQISADGARRFFFTNEEQSYGAWLGDTRNLGIIAAAVFREALPERQPQVWSAPRDRREQAPSASGAPGAAPPMAQGKAQSRSESAADEEYAATGIGREVDHPVERVAFRCEPGPAAMLELRYEYRDELVRLGVLPRPWIAHRDRLDRRERARGFEGFAPDPYDP